MTGALRRAFERAAGTYDAHSVLQHEVGARLLQHLEGIRIEPQLVIDLGCGTGAFLRELRVRYPKARLCGVDIAEAMLDRAARRDPWWKRALDRSPPMLACADAERLPLAGASAQFVFSNLMLQWTRPQMVFAEAARVLQAGGLFLFSTFGPDTLKELRAAFVSAGAGERINAFVDMHDLGDALVHAGFADPVMEMEMVTLEYSTVEAIARDLKAVGSRAMSTPPYGGLAPRSRWRRVREHYERERRDGVLPASYEVVYGHAWKAAPRKIADGRQIIDFRAKP